jgi:hypothetical protein
MGAIKDAQRLATKVKRQQTQLGEYEQRIADLETPLRWYRIALNLQSDEPAPSREGEAFETSPGLRDIEPRGEPAAPPEGDLGDEGPPTDDRNVAEATGQILGTPYSDHKIEDRSPGDDNESRLSRWIRQWWS